MGSSSRGSHNVLKYTRAQILAESPLCPKGLGLTLLAPPPRMLWYLPLSSAPSLWVTVVSSPLTPCLSPPLFSPHASPPTAHSPFPVPSPHAFSYRGCPRAGCAVCFRHLCWPGHGVFKCWGSAPAAAKTQAGTVGHSFIPLLSGEGHSTCVGLCCCCCTGSRSGGAHADELSLSRCDPVTNGLCECLTAALGQQRSRSLQGSTGGQCRPVLSPIPRRVKSCWHRGFAP